MVNDDLGLDTKWSPISVVNHTSTMTSLAFEHLANNDRDNDKKIAYLHASPGFVRTTIFSRLTPPESSGLTWRMTLATIRGVVSVVMLLFGISEEESGERHAYHLTCEDLGPGAIRIDKGSEVVHELGVLEKYRGSWPERVWEHTVGVTEKALAK